MEKSRAQKRTGGRDRRAAQAKATKSRLLSAELRTRRRPQRPTGIQTLSASIQVKTREEAHRQKVGGRRPAHELRKAKHDARLGLRGMQPHTIQDVAVDARRAKEGPDTEKEARIVCVRATGMQRGACNGRMACVGKGVRHPCTTKNGGKGTIQSNMAGNWSSFVFCLFCCY